MVKDWINLFSVDPKNNPSDEGNKPRSIEELQRQITDEHYDHVTRKPRQAGEPFMR